MSLAVNSERARDKGRRAQQTGLPISANPYNAIMCRNNQRHRFTTWDGRSVRHCTRCYVPRQNAVEKQLARYWRAGWQARWRDTVA